MALDHAEGPAGAYGDDDDDDGGNDMELPWFAAPAAAASADSVRLRGSILVLTTDLPFLFVCSL